MRPLFRPYRCDVLPDPSFHVIGISHHTARVEERERFALTPEDVAALLDQEQLAGRSAVILSTCNRCEYYWSGDGDGEAWLRKLARARGANLDVALTRHHGKAAVRHLFRIAAGLDSQVLGETEILGQVRRAYDAARAAGTTTRDTDLIFSAALSAGRRVRRETILGRHPASVSSAAVNLVVEQWTGTESKQAVVVGAGETAEGVLRALQECGVREVSLLSRRPERSQVLAEAWSAVPGQLTELDQKLRAADLLVVATASSRPLVSADLLSQAVAGRGGRPLSVIDLGVPRQVEPSAREVEGLFLYDLDDLQRLCCPADAAGSATLAEAEQVIDDELARLGLSLNGRMVAPRLAELHRLGVEMAEEEAGWALDRLESLSEEQRDVVRQMADRLVRRVLYPVSRSLRGSPTFSPPTPESPPD